MTLAQEAESASNVAVISKSPRTPNLVTTDGPWPSPAGIVNRSPFFSGFTSLASPAGASIFSQRMSYFRRAKARASSSMSTCRVTSSSASRED